MSLLWKRWVRERGTDCYCPIDDSDGCVVLGMNMIGEPPADAEVVGEFYFDEVDGLIIVPAEATQ